MAGHSHWAKIKRAKGANDAKRGKMFSKIARKIIVAARNGGGDPNMNIPLRYAMDEARSVNMPNDAVQRNIARGTGEAGGVSYEECTYEAFYTGGAGLLVEALTDNRNRTIGEVRTVIEKRGGKMAVSGAVKNMFSKKGVILVPRFVERAEGRKTVKEEVKEDTVMEVALEAGAEDFLPSDDSYEIRTPVSELEAVKKALADKNIKTESAEVVSIPANTVTLDVESTRKALAMVDALEDNDDVQKVFYNFEVTDEALAGA